MGATEVHHTLELSGWGKGKPVALNNYQATTHACDGSFATSRNSPTIHTASFALQLLNRRKKNLGLPLAGEGQGWSSRHW